MAKNNADMTAVLEQYRKDMAEQRKMYESNVSLCRDFASVTSDLREIVTLNIQTMTECKDAINQNQFCPVIRISKKKAMRLVDEEGLGVEMKRLFNCTDPASFHSWDNSPSASNCARLALSGVSL